jgi:hypothetical protein
MAQTQLRGSRGRQRRTAAELAAALLLFAGAGCALLQTDTLASAGRANEAAHGDGAWLARAQEEIASREYRASENGSGLQAPNRAHNLRTFFERTGIRVHDRTAGGSPELLRLSLTGMGRGAQIAAVAPGEEVVADEHRVEIRRPGLVEWYVNSEAGLEQGFTIAKRAEGEGRLVVELAVAGARAALRGDTIVFRTASGRKLRYGSLVVHDAAGARLPARFGVAGSGRVRIAVEDAEASYPIVIDGSGRVRGEFESCPPGVEVGDASCTTAVTPGWVAVNGTAPEAVLSHTFDFDFSEIGLAPGTPFEFVATYLAQHGYRSNEAIGASDAPGEDINVAFESLNFSGYESYPLPEPSRFAMLGSGVLALLALRWAQKAHARAGRTAGTLASSASSAASARSIALATKRSSETAPAPPTASWTSRTM